MYDDKRMNGFVFKLIFTLMVLLTLPEQRPIMHTNNLFLMRPAMSFDKKNHDEEPLSKDLFKVDQVFFYMHPIHQKRGCKLKPWGFLNIAIDS